MKRNLLTATALFMLCVTTLIVAVHSGVAQRNVFESPGLAPSRAGRSLMQPTYKDISSAATLPVSSSVQAPAHSPATRGQSASRQNQPVVSSTQPEKSQQSSRSGSITDSNRSKHNSSRSQSKRTTPTQPTRQPKKVQLAAHVKQSQPLPTDCAIQPEPPAIAKARRSPKPTEVLNPDRYHRSQPRQPTAQRPQPDYTPREMIVQIHPSNYGDRFLLDVNGKPATQRPIVVLHETVASASSTINFFRTPHSRDQDQASYHTLIQQDGTILYLVPADKRAYGAGNSAFMGNQGLETVRTHANLPPSVNNFAYHISLETPADGVDNARSHSGYTDNQYQSLAWLVAKTAVMDDRITTHKDVDRSGSRIDPRSFDFSYFMQLLTLYPKTAEIPLQCTIPPAVQVKSSTQLPNLAVANSRQ